MTYVYQKKERRPANSWAAPFFTWLLDMWYRLRRMSTHLFPSSSYIMLPGYQCLGDCILAVSILSFLKKNIAHLYLQEKLSGQLQGSKYIRTIQGDALSQAFRYSNIRLGQSIGGSTAPATNRPTSVSRMMCFV